MFGPILMNFCQNVWLGKISDEFGNRSCQIENKVTKSNLRKNLVYALEATFSLMKLGQNVCLENRSHGVKIWVTMSNFRKTLCTLKGPHFHSDTHVR